MATIRKLLPTEPLARLFARPPAALDSVFPTILWRMPPRQELNELYLTFDDGPHPEFTPALLDILAAHGAHATFFIVGERAARQPQLVEKISESGHSIGNHSYTHQRLRWCSTSIATQEIRATHRLLSGLPGFVPVLRPPFGAFGPALLRAVRHCHYTLAMWSYDPADYSRAWQPESLAETLVARCRAGDIVLLHDGHENSGTTLAALDPCLKQLIAHGFTFRPLTVDSLHEMVKFGSVSK